MVQFTAACVQLNAQSDLEANIALAETLVREAAGSGAQFISLPENAFFMQERGQGLSPDYEEPLTKMRALAQELRVWILIGSIHPPIGNGKTWNRCLLIDDKGKVASQYDKIHLFNATLKNGETYSESDRMEGGDTAVVAEMPWGKMGLSICYDLRFPHLYRALARAGAIFLSIPSAFTYTTGSAHWHALLRARAIENGCYVIAPAQCGMHPGNRRTYGHSLIVDPWGGVIAEASEDKTGIVTSVIDTDHIADVRAMIPSLKHDRAFTLKIAEKP